MLASGLRSPLPSIVVVIATTVGLVAGGCDSPDEAGDRAETSSESSSSESTPSTSSDDGPPVVAEAGSIELTLEDYDRFLRQSRLFAPTDETRLPEIPTRRKKSPRAQIQTVRTILEHAVIRRLAEKRDISVSEADIDAHLRESDDLSRFVAAPDASAGPAMEVPEALSREDLREAARVQLLRRKLREALLADLTTEDLWKMYRRRHDTVRIGYVSVPNSPAPDSIDRFLERTDSSKIKAYAKDHAKRYRRPKLVHLAIVRPPAGGDVDEATLKKAADQLEGGTPADRVADEVGLEAEPDAYLVRKENREAFGGDKGATGYQMEGPRGAYAWRVEGWRKGGDAELDRALEREVAADMLSQTVVPSVLVKLQPVLEAMRGVERNDDGTVADGALRSLKKRLADRGRTLQVSEAFSRSDDGRVPGLGLAKSIFDRAFELGAEQPVAEEPVLSRGRAVAMMLVERNRPERKAFESEKEAFRKKVVEQKKDLIVDEYVRRWLSEHEPDIELEPVREKYGVMKKK